MNLMFGRREIEERGKGLTFDDVLLVPRYSEVTSRRLPCLKTSGTRKHRLDIPIMSSNMDTITEREMMWAMAQLGGLGVLHRFMEVEEQVLQIKKIRRQQDEEGFSFPLAASVGVKKEGQERADYLGDMGVDILIIDIAHGDSVMMLTTLDYIKKKWPNIDVIAGNVATAEGICRLAEHGADGIKVGIGPGSMCTTRVVSGHGMPQLTSIALCSIEAQRHGVPIIADGGIRNSGDIVKSLCAGADTVMIGSLISGTSETPGEIQDGKRPYRGMASKEAQVGWRGSFPEKTAPEGEAMMVPCKGAVADIIGKLTGGLRSGMTYLGVDTIEKMPQAALFMEVTSAGRAESYPHGLNSL